MATVLRTAAASRGTRPRGHRIGSVHARCLVFDRILVSFSFGSGCTHLGEVHVEEEWFLRVGHLDPVASCFGGLVVGQRHGVWYPFVCWVMKRCSFLLSPRPFLGSPPGSKGGGIQKPSGSLRGFVPFQTESERGRGFGDGAGDSISIDGEGGNDPSSFSFGFHPTVWMETVGTIHRVKGKEKETTRVRWRMTRGKESTTRQHPSPSCVAFQGDDATARSQRRRGYGTTWRCEVGRKFIQDSYDVLAGKLNRSILISK